MYTITETCQYLLLAGKSFALVGPPNTKIVRKKIAMLTVYNNSLNYFSPKFLLYINGTYDVYKEFKKKHQVQLNKH